MNKILHENYNEIAPYLHCRGETLQWALSKIWMIRSPFFYEIKNNILFIYKISKFYGKPVMYLVTAPKTLNNDYEAEYRALTEVNKEFDINLTSEEVKLYTQYNPNLSKQAKPKFREFCYDVQTYDNMVGKEFKNLRSVLNQAGTYLKLEVHENDKSSTQAVQEINQVWKQNRRAQNRIVAKHVDWFAKQMFEYDNTVFILREAETNNPICYDIAGKIGNTIFNYDEKHLDMGSYPVGRAIHMLMAQYYTKKFPNEKLIINSGMAGGPKLELSKMLLKPVDGLMYINRIAKNIL